MSGGGTSKVFWVLEVSRANVTDRCGGRSTPAWSATHLGAEREAIVPALLTALSESGAGALPQPLTATAHRWRYARADATAAPTDRCVWLPDLALGACGDWLSGPRVESAWLSGRALGELVR